MKVLYLKKIPSLFTNSAMVATAQGCANGYCPSGVYSSSHWMRNWFGDFGIILSLIFWILVAVAIIYLVKHLSRNSQSGSRSDEALEILKKRFAKGEITKEDYDNIKKELNKM